MISAPRLVLVWDARDHGRVAFKPAREWPLARAASSGRRHMATARIVCPQDQRAVYERVPVLLLRVDQAHLILPREGGEFTRGGRLRRHAVPLACWSRCTRSRATREGDD